MKASQSRRHDGEEVPSSTSLDAPDVSAGDANSSQLREERRALKKASKEAIRLAKLEAKQIRSEQKRAARKAKRESDVVELVEEERGLVEPEATEEKPSAPRARSSFDELMGYPHQ